MNKGDKIQKMNALHQTNQKGIPLDLLSALPETQEVASIISKTKKKKDCLSAEMWVFLSLFLISISTNIHKLAMFFRNHQILCLMSPGRRIPYTSVMV